MSSNPASSSGQRDFRIAQNLKALHWHEGRARVGVLGTRSKMGRMKLTVHMSLFSFKLVRRTTDYTLTSWEQQLSKLSVSGRLIPFNYLVNQEVKRQKKIYEAIQLTSSPFALANSLVKISIWGQNSSLLLFCVDIIEKMRKNNICSFIPSFHSFIHNFLSHPHP